MEAAMPNKTLELVKQLKEEAEKLLQLTKELLEAVKQWK